MVRCWLSKKKERKKEKQKKTTGKWLCTRSCTDYICAQQVLATPPRFADRISRVELHGASWKLRIKFYPITNVTEQVIYNLY